MICFAAKWSDTKRVEFYSEHHDGHDEMVGQAWRLWDEADAIVHFNGTNFDLPHLRREFLLSGLTPPSPVQEIDLLRVVRKHFRFTSNKLDHVSQQVGLSGKVSHEGHGLWTKCLAGDELAWKRMRKYNIGDVKLTEELYHRLLPWIDGHPHEGLHSGDDGVCGRCGSAEIQPRGFSYTAVSKFQRYRCAGCGSWSRGKSAVSRIDERAVAQ